MANENCLEGLRCPGCGAFEPFYIDAKVNVLVFDDGTDECANFEWDADASCTCRECKHVGTVKTFREAGTKET